MGRVDQEYLKRRMSAADGGQPQALYDLGLLYSTGQGVELDYIVAHKWFNLAAMRGVRRARVDRAELARDMSPWEIAEAQRLAREWQTDHAGCAPNPQVNGKANGGANGKVTHANSHASEKFHPRTNGPAAARYTSA